MKTPAELMKAALEGKKLTLDHWPEGMFVFINADGFWEYSDGNYYGAPDLSRELEEG